VLSDRPLNLLFVSTTVGPLGSGLGGGVELTLPNIAIALQQQGHRITVAAPAGSKHPDLSLVQIPGALQSLAQSHGRDAAIVMPANSVLANLWNYAHQVQDQYDLILNFAYDWLPFYLTPFFRRPIAHLVSMGSLNDAMDQVIGAIADQFPGTIGVHSQAQAATFPFANRCHCLGNGFDLSQYEFCATPDLDLIWIGRIAPEKGLEDGIAAAVEAGCSLQILGAISDHSYWQRICTNFPQAQAWYQGFFSTPDMQQRLRRSRALLMTPRWMEAFGNVAVEALACGVPVIAYRRGGPAEIVEPGKTGFLVEPDSVPGLVRAIAQLDKIDRQTCRQQAEARYSLSAIGDRVEAWLRNILSQS